MTYEEQPTTPPICPYCSEPAVLGDTAKIYYGKSYGKAWICTNYPACDSYIGVHKGTDKPLGRMADKLLRESKIQAHAAFDPLWMRKMKRENLSVGKARDAGYCWLAEQLGIPREDCHIGMFDVEMCRKVIQVCNPFSKAARQDKKETATS